MGANKAFLNFGGQTLLDRALAALRAACGEVAIVGDLETFRSHGSVVSDVFAGCGPLAGIHAALLHSSAKLNMVLAVDMPFVSQELLHFLMDVADAIDATVTVPRNTSGLQPLCAVYRRDFASIAERALMAGKYKIDAAFTSVSLRVVEESELAAAGFTEKSFFNLNTPQDRHAAEGFSF